MQYNKPKNIRKNYSIANIKITSVIYSDVNDSDSIARGTIKEGRNYKGARLIPKFGRTQSVRTCFVCYHKLHIIYHYM